jgi:cytochrome c oxidase assembly protein subunit 15
LTALRWTSGVALVLTYGLIVLGAWVRATGSGLSCPDWPTCYGHWVPLPGDIPPDVGYSYLQVMLEWVHRLIAGVILGPLILAIGVLAWRARDTRPRMPAYAGGLILLLLVQAGLGGVTVLDQNSPWSVALHLGTALVLLSVLCLIFERSGEGSHRGASAARTLSTVVWLLTLGAMVSAAMVTKTGAALACGTSWPLCDGALVPYLGDPQIRLHFTHRLLALGAGLGVLALAIGARSRAEVRPLAWLALALVVVEIGLGAAVVLGEVPFGVALAHQALGVLIFAILSLVMWRTHGRASETEIAHGLSHA